MKRQRARGETRHEFAVSARWLSVLFFFTLLPLLIFVISLVRDGWKAIINLAIGLLALAVIVLLAKRMPSHCDQRLRRAVDEKLQGREQFTPQQFAERYYAAGLQPVAARLRELLDACMGFEVSGLRPADNFVELLRLEKPTAFSWMDDPLEAAFFEEVATEFSLTFRDVENWETFHSFDDLVRYVGEPAQRSSEAHAQTPVTPS